MAEVFRRSEKFKMVHDKKGGNFSETMALKFEVIGVIIPFWWAQGLNLTSEKKGGLGGGGEEGKKKKERKA